MTGFFFAAALRRDDDRGAAALADRDAVFFRGPALAPADVQLVTVRRFPFSLTTRLEHRFSEAMEALRDRVAAARRAAATALRDGRRTTNTWPARTLLPLIPLIARSCATEMPLRRATLASDSPDRTRTRFDASELPELP